MLLAAVAEPGRPLIPDGTEVLAGLELGGVPVATALSLVTGLPGSLRPQGGQALRHRQLAEGAAVDGRRVLVVEDVITTGGQVVDLHRRAARARRQGRPGRCA